MRIEMIHKDEARVLYLIKQLSESSPKNLIQRSNLTELLKSLGLAEDDESAERTIARCKYHLYLIGKDNALTIYLEDSLNEKLAGFSEEDYKLKVQKEIETHLK